MSCGMQVEVWEDSWRFIAGTNFSGGVLARSRRSLSRSAFSSHPPSPVAQLNNTDPLRTRSLSFSLDPALRCTLRTCLPLSDNNSLSIEWADQEHSDTLHIRFLLTAQHKNLSGEGLGTVGNFMLRESSRQLVSCILAVFLRLEYSS